MTPEQRSLLSALAGRGGGHLLLLVEECLEALEKTERERYTWEETAIQQTREISRYVVCKLDLEEEQARLERRVLELEQGSDWGKNRCSECGADVLVRIECKDHKS